MSIPNRVSWLLLLGVTLAIIVTILFYYFKNPWLKSTDHPNAIYKRFDSPFPLNQWDRKVLCDSCGLQSTDQMKAGLLWFPHDMGIGDLEYGALDSRLQSQIWTGILPGSDVLVCKTRLALFAKTMSIQVQSYLPKSFTKAELKDVAQSSMGKLYIAKSNQQRQQGVVIYEKLPLETDLSAETAIVQEILPNPLLILLHKATFRVYLLAWIQGRNSTNLWIYRDGFMYYATKPYSMTSSDLGVHVASGYNGRSVYQNRPLTHQEYFRVEDQRRKKVKGWSEKTVQELFARSLRAVTCEFLDPNRDFIKRNAIGSFQLFGVDIQINQDLNAVHILEYNKCPNLEPMDDARDYKVKKEMSESMWQILCPKIGLSCTQGKGLNGAVSSQWMQI